MAKNGIDLGTYWIQVAPSADGFWTEFQKQVGGSGGKQAGVTLGKAVQTGFQAGLGGFSSAALDSLSKDVAKASASYEAASRKSADAAGKLRVAEAQLNEIRAKGGDTSARLVAAEERFAAAQRSAADAAGTSKAAADRVREAKEKLADAEKKTASATEAGGKSASKSEGYLARLRTALYSTEGSFDGLGTEVKETNGLLGNFALGGAIAGVASSITSSITSSIGELASEAITASDATDKFKGTLNFAGLDDSAISNLTASTRQYADETVYGLDDIQNITAQLASNSVKDYDKLAEAAGNLNAVSGGTAETYKSVGMVLTQTAGQGKLTTENWNQLSDAIPGASGRLQEALLSAGAFTGNFREEMAAGEITAEEFNTALLGLGNDPVAVEAAKSVTTFEGMIGNLQATVVGGLSDAITELKPQIGTFIGFFSDTIEGAVPILVGFVQGIAPLGEAVGGIITILTTGDFQGGIFGLDEDAPVISFLFTLRESAQSVFDILTQGDFTGPIFGLEEDSALVGFFFSLRDAAQGVVAWFQDASTGAVPAIMEGFRGVGDVLGGIISFVDSNSDWLVPMTVGVIAFVAAYKAVVFVTGVMAALRSGTMLATAAQWALNIAMNANPIGLIIAGVAALTAGLVWFFTQTELGQQVWQNIVSFISTAITWLWESVLSPVFTAIGAIFTWLYDNVISPIVAGIVLYVQVWAAIFTWLWDNVLSPVFTAIGAIFSWIYNNVVMPIVTGIVILVQAWAAIFNWLWTSVLSVVFAAVGAIFNWLYTNVITPIVNGVVAYMQLWGQIFNWLYTNVVSPVFTAVGAVFTWLYENVITPVWSGIQSAISVVADWITNTLWPGIQSVIGFIGSGFESMGSTIATVWENIKKAAVAPINFVIETVYNDGIKTLFDDIAEAVGLDIRMPEASPIAFAQGGVLPGYTPGRDVHEFYSPTGGRLALSGGEGIIRPDALRALGGKAWLDSVNGARGSADGVAFAGGGIWDDITGGIAGAASWIGDAVGNVAKIMSDPSGAIDSLIRTPVKALLESIGGGSFGSMVAEIPLKAIDGIAEWAQTNILPPSPSGTGNWAGGITLERLQPILAKYPSLMITDTYRDPAYNAAVGGSPTSYHMDATNPAVDVAGPYSVMDAFANEVRSIGGWRQILWEVAGHFDHVHVANQGGVFGDLPTRTYDSGGVLEPGLTLAYNGTGKPEPIMTAGQWEAIENYANGNTSNAGMPSELVIVDQDGQLIGRMRVEAADVAVRTLEEVG
ncbi:tape measure protein [Pseudoclavibacter sp. AY1H1]|uniref:tape measure protein n=1 Tax=Pseudoclavibacter sp. AY1H1 TaxID=2080584 RepID=UPI000CE90A4B|nr:tape measure protein [Pseudoclavibacter sp. AY1H1]PPF39978.1 hypothetical protein C5E05_01835 [Pseudoclavibacter sp. AY1H1]